MKNFRILNNLILIPAFFILTLPSFAQTEELRTPGEILSETGDPPSPEAIHELFENGTTGNWIGGEIEVGSREALIELSEKAVPTLLEYLPVSAVLQRHFLDIIIREIGSPANPFLIPYLESDDFYTRYHAAYLLGDTMAAQELEDPLELGPLPEDVPALEALISALEIEEHWRVKSTIVTSIGKSRDPGQVELLKEYLSDDDQSVRLGCVTGLSNIPHEDAVNALIYAFSDELMTVRQAAMLAFADETMGYNESMFKLLDVEYRSSDDRTSRLCSLEALARWLENQVDSDSGEVLEVRNAVYSVSQHIIDISNDPADWQLRGFAAELLGHTYHPDALSFLEEIRETELHPFVLGKINEAIDRLEEGRPIEAFAKDNE